MNLFLTSGITPLKILFNLGNGLRLFTRAVRRFEIPALSPLLNQFLRVGFLAKATPLISTTIADQPYKYQLTAALITVSTLFSSGCATPSLPLRGCATQSAVLCENFEQAPHTSRLSSNNLSITQEYTFEGEQALKVTSRGGGYNHNYLSYPIEETSAEYSHYGRMMIFLSNASHHSGDFSLLQIGGNSSVTSGAPAGTRVVSRGRIDARFDHVFANYDTPGDRDKNGSADWLTDCWKHPSFDDAAPPPQAYIVPKGEWVCLQWHVDSARHRLKLWMNGESLKEIEVEGTGDGCLGNSQGDFWIAPNRYDTIKVGIEEYHQNAKPRTMYIDNLEVSTQPVACPVL